MTLRPLESPERSAAGEGQSELEQAHPGQQEPQRPFLPSKPVGPAGWEGSLDTGDPGALL